MNRTTSTTTGAPRPTQWPTASRTATTISAGSSPHATRRIQFLLDVASCISRYTIPPRSPRVVTSSNRTHEDPLLEALAGNDDRKDGLVEFGGKGKASEEPEVAGPGHAQDTISADYPRVLHPSTQPVNDCRRADVRNANRAFFATVFREEGTSTLSGCREVSCTICDERFHHRINKGNLRRHSLSHSCLAARSKRPLPEEGGDDSTCVLATAPDDSGPSPALVLATMKAYCEEHFVPSVDVSQHVRVCRNCCNYVMEGKVNPDLSHLGRCLGFEHVLRDLEKLVRGAVVKKKVAEKPMGRADTQKANRDFLLSTLNEKVSVPGNCEVTCAICLDRFRYNRYDSLYRHALSQPCLTARVKRLLPVAGGEGTSILASAARYEKEPSPSLVRATMKAYCEECFVPSDDVRQSDRVCRNCCNHVMEGKLYPDLSHVGRCCGLENVLRELEELLVRRVVLENMAAQPEHTSPIASGARKRAKRSN